MIPKILILKVYYIMKTADRMNSMTQFEMVEIEKNCKKREIIVVLLPLK